MWFALFLGLVFFLVAVLVWFQGFWGGVIAVVQILFAALLATSLYEPVAASLAGQMPAYSYLLDLFTIWGIFVVAYGVSRTATELLSRKRVQFHPGMELGGRSVAALVAAYLFTMFAAFTVHLAPLQAKPFGGWDPMSKESVALRPDIQWMNFVRGQSQMGLRGKTVFDPRGTFTGDFYKRREAFEKEEGYLVR